MKRFYTLVSRQEEPGGYSIRLDGKPVKTPARHILLAPNAALADVLVAEWAGQGEKIEPAAMPLTQILSTKIDRVARERPAMETAVLKYLDTDLLCYRVSEPPELARMQGKAWDPGLDWFENRFGPRLLTTTGLAALRQPDAAHEAAADFVRALDDDRFTALQLAVSLSGSLVLALAFTEGALDAGHLCAAASVEERHKDAIYNAARHGPDPAQEKKNRAMARNLEAAARFLALLAEE